MDWENAPGILGVKMDWENPPGIIFAFGRTHRKFYRQNIDLGEPTGKKMWRTHRESFGRTCREPVGEPTGNAALPFELSNWSILFDPEMNLDKVLCVFFSSA